MKQTKKIYETHYKCLQQKVFFSNWGIREYFQQQLKKVEDEQQKF